MQINTHSAKETIEAGKRFAKKLKSKDVVLLEGALGGGKTTFIKGVLKGLKSSNRVISPTFTLIKEYSSKAFKIYHIDLYRLKKIEDMYDIGLGDYLYAKGSLCFIEWGEKIEAVLPVFKKLVFSYSGENSRKIIFGSKVDKSKR